MPRAFGSSAAEDEMAERMRAEHKKRAGESDAEMLERHKKFKAMKVRDAFSAPRSYGCLREVILQIDPDNRCNQDIRRGFFMQAWGLAQRKAEENADLITKFQKAWDNGMGNVHVLCRITYGVQVTNSSTEFGFKDGTATYKGARANAQMVIPQSAAQQIVDNTHGNFTWGVKINQCLVSCVLDADCEFGEGTQEVLACIDVMDTNARGRNGESVFRSVATRIQRDDLKAKGKQLGFVVLILFDWWYCNLSARAMAPVLYRRKGRSLM